MKTILLLVVIFVNTMVFSQNPLTQNSNNLELEQKARELTKKYNSQLALRAKQLNLFEIKVEEFLINEQKIRNSDMTVERKLVELEKNYEKETADIGDILTRPQLKLYKSLKEEYQPIAPVVVKEATSQKDG
ncbi:hypothetical protein J8281_00705 [Aquimarina sp. U1-2]|uniref:hypothetical protein n=1 Tax=Aquimarina sp. U1-2 TaxID=2823141 RepID=UPI001AEC9973|nr:hypothetical protein [Aquimarina sp. U1-2]MBP2830690.1 hypothetical protein [Aquimarina sp. U1-2]